MQGVGLPEAIYTELRGHGTHLTIETVAQFSRPKGVIKSHLLVWLRGRTEGVYCVTWHATPSDVETDPLYPNTLPVTDALLSRLGNVQGVSRCGVSPQEAQAHLDRTSNKIAPNHF